MILHNRPMRLHKDVNFHYFAMSSNASLEMRQHLQRDELAREAGEQPERTKRELD
jgi:hypothetical protein